MLREFSRSSIEEFIIEIERFKSLFSVYFGQHIYFGPMNNKIFLFLTISTLLMSCSTAKRANDITEYNVITSAIESGLRPKYGVIGEPQKQWTLIDRMAHYSVPGVSIAVAVDGELVWAKAYGKRSKSDGIDINVNTVFQAASLSKPIASLAALRLVDQGLIDLDAPVNDYLKRWKIPENEYTRSNPVTLRHLLSHRAGTTVHGYPGYRADQNIPSIVDVLNGSTPANTKAVIVTSVPGSSYKYSGGGFTIVQLLVEDISGLKFRDFVQREIFSFNSMVRSNYAYPQPSPNAATGHVGNNSEPIPQPGYAYPELAAAGVWTTPSELVLLGVAVAEARNSKSTLLSEKLARQLVPNSADEVGLGFGLNDSGDGVAFVHNGHNTGYSARWINYADGRASVAILTNSDSGEGLIREILSALGYAFGWKQDSFEQRKTQKLTPQQYELLSGEYVFSPDQNDPALTLKHEEGGLWIEAGFIEKAEFHSASAPEFFIEKGLNFTIDWGDANSSPSLNIEGEVTLVKKTKTKPAKKI